MKFEVSFLTYVRRISQKRTLGGLQKPIEQRMWLITQTYFYLECY